MMGSGQKRAGVGWLVTLGLLACAMTLPAVPAQALEYGISPWLLCADNEEAAELSTPHMPLEPASGATVSAGTPVTFSTESLLHNAPTFNVASSEGLLSSPDIDSGTGLQSGAFYRFTSTKATATPRTIYWTASFTFTPTDCESPSTFTTPIHTLVVAPSEAELAAAKRRQEEAAAKMKQEEEAAGKKAEEAAAIVSVSLEGSTIAVQSSGEAQVKLTCTGTGTCTGKLLLTVQGAARKGKKFRMRKIAEGSFSVPAGKAATIELKLSGAGRARLGADHGHLNASLTILGSSPAPSQTHTENVYLLQQKTAKTRKP